MGTREKWLGSLPSSNWAWEAGSRQPPASCSLQYLPDPAAVYQSIDFISKALRMLNRWENLLWGNQGLGENHQALLSGWYGITPWIEK